MNTVAVPLHWPLLRGEKRLRLALVGQPAAGATAIFRDVESARVATREAPDAWDQCEIDIGLDQARVVRLPSVRSLHAADATSRAVLNWLLLSPRRPDVIIQVLDATALERHLELTLELLELGRPLVLAINRMDEARDKGMHIGTSVLARRLGVAVVPSIATKGYGIRELFAAAADAARRGISPLPVTPSTQLRARLRLLAAHVPHAGVPPLFLATRIAEGDAGFAPLPNLQHFPSVPTRDELHADRHHQAAILAETATRPAGVRERHDWRYWLDELFLSPRAGLIGSALAFAAVLYVVFGLSVRIDALTTAPLAAWVSSWQPQGTVGVVGRAIADGLVGLVGIVVPYMIPLVLLLIALEQTGVMARIAFAVDRVFHRLGLHGGVAIALLLGLGCNVPALAAVGRTTHGSERTIASLLITFVPCSARSAIILALAGKYLGAAGVLAVFAVAALVIALMGQVLRRRFTPAAPGQILEIPPYAMPRLGAVVRETWTRTNDILIIVTPLLVGGSIVLALLAHWGADRAINLALVPITQWWLGLPAVLGVPLLFGVLRKELSLAMIYTALGGFAVDAYLAPLQIFTFLVFLTLYVPCISTFAVMLRTVGRRRALASVAVSVGVALAVSGVLRFALQAVQFLAT